MLNIEKKNHKEKYQMNKVDKTYITELVVNLQLFS